MTTEETPEQKRESVLQQNGCLKAANDEMLKVIKKVQLLKPEIELRLGGIVLEEKFEEVPPYISLGYNRKFLCFVNWTSSLFKWYEPTDVFKVLIFKEIGEWIYTEDGKLKYPRPKHEYKQVAQEHIYLRYENNGWVDSLTGKSFLKSDDLIEIWVNKFVNYVQKKSR